MFCPKCGRQLPDDAQFCGNCGHQIGAAGQGAPHAASANSAGAPVAATNGNTSKLIGLLALVVLALAIVGVLFAIGTFSGPKLVTEVKPSVDSYSWSEISLISNEIAQAKNESDAIKIAKTYNLCNADGTLDGSQIKSVNLENGQLGWVQIIGFAHDDKTAGGKAGITFQFKDCIAEHEMNSEDINEGGWRASKMRSYLQQDVLPLLPVDLRSVIAPVDKLTNNIGCTSETSSVSITSDQLWLPSYVELAGTLSVDSLIEAYRGYLADEYGWTAEETEERIQSLTGDRTWYESFCAVLNAEGMQYKLFADQNVGLGANYILTKSYNGESCGWWERSPDPLDSVLFRIVEFDGSPIYYGHASYSYGVAPGFCI